MSEMKEYLEAKLAEFSSKHNIQAKLDRYDGDLKRQWKRDKERTSNLWQEIMTVADVQRYIESFIIRVEQEEQARTTDLCTYEADLALYRVDYAIRKMVRCFDNSACDFNQLDREAIDRMFALICDAVEKKENVVMRRAMWD